MSVDTKIIIKNTLMLYLRQIVVMVLQLISVRILLKTLGFEDYGIYNVVAGIVMLLSFLTGTMASATQRFFSFALGKEDSDLLNKAFGTNIFVYGMIALVALLLFETIGLWFVHNRLNIPADRVFVVKVLYQFSILSFLASMVSAPYIAIMIAHEEMNIYARISILEACLKFVSVLFLFVIFSNKLFFYGLLILFSALIIAVLYGVICTKRYPECSFHTCRFERSFLKEIMNYTGWTLFGSLSSVIRSQAITILVNQFFTPITVSARAIALSVSSSLNSFTSNFSTGLYPPIIKTWAAGDKEEMYRLVYSGCKIAFFLNWVCVLPCFLNIDFLLKLWLKDLPPDASLFTKLAMIETVILSVSGPLMTAARAAGDMKKYELPLGIIQIMIFPVSWFILYLGGAAWTTLAVAIGANIVMFFVRILIVAHMTGLSIRQYIIKTLFPISYVVLISTIVLVLIRFALNNHIWISVFYFIGCFMFVILAIFFFGLQDVERGKVKSIISCRIKGITGG